jgi:hypothetical protein
MPNSDRAATGVPARSQEKGVFCEVATYELAATAASTTINMIKVEAGTTVLDGYIIYDDCGTGATVDVGDGSDVDRFIDGADVSTAAGLSRFAVGAGGLTFPYTYAADDTIDILTLGAETTGTITLVAFLTRELVDLT